MAVTFTPNIGLAKPTESEIAEDWVNFNQRQAANNLIIIDKMDVNVISYTPAFIGQFADPNTGVGTRKGEYYDFQGFVVGTFNIRLVDPGVALGSGEYGIALPFVADNTFHTVGTAFGSGAGGANSCIGEGYLNDASAVATSGTTAMDVITISGVSYARLVTETYTGKTGAVLGNSAPFGLANGDSIAGSFCYKRT